MSWLIWLHQLILVSLLFSQVVTCSSSWSSSTSAHHTCLEDQKFSLLQFKKTFTITSGLTFPECESYTHPKMVFWNESTDCCSWDGVTCDWLNGHVIGLDLSCSKLQGTIQGNSSLFHLRQLQRLNLAFNDFSFSKILSRFGSFTSLTHLNLSNSLFAGPIPSEICHLSKLISLDMSNYNSQWRLEQHTFNMILQNLTQLKELHLDWVDISSPLPHALLNLSSLTSLSLGFCQLHGKFLENIFHLPNLQKLIVQYNGDLMGKLPNFNVTSSLQFLDLSWTSFSGQLPDSIDNLKALNRFYVSSSNFSGSIPASFWNLTKITSLDFSHNVFSGQIPPSISNLAKLIDLDLSVNNFSGQIPNSIGNMSQLAFLDLSGNQLIGPIPLYAVGLSKLTFLGLSNNSLNGTLPSWLFAQPSLVSIDLRNNKLQGPIPRSIYELANLTYLDLSSNNLGGVVELYKLLKLKYLSLLDLSYNGLSLSIDNSLNSTTLPSLEIIGLGSCNLTEFPNFLREQTGLFSLDLSNNKINGEVPKWVLDVGKFSLTRLDLSHNFLSAGLEQLPWLVLQYIDLHDNLLHGLLPVPPITTTVFLISSNKFTGEIPPLICGLGLLKVLDLSNNSLSGMIPQCLGNLSNSLSVLNLRMNSFHGAFTAIFAKGSTLRNLNLNDNQIEGQVPRSLLNCGRLEVLDLGRNKINDTFPYWLETLPELQVLVLKFNRFHGHINTFKTKSKLHFPKLRIIDISHNEFTGLLPTNYISRFEAMMNVDEHEFKLKYMGDMYYKDYVVVIVKGHEIEYSRILTVFSIIDLSSNKFIGEIPKSIGRLNSLRGLNLSHNKLKGHIPTSLGNLSNLESLDLSSNQLVGEIPQQLTSLMFLAVLNLSYNHLVGQIPQGRQFNTFGKDSYNGNWDLCGFPLSKKCEELQPLPPPPTLHEDENSDRSSGFSWKVVAMGYGCGFVFGMVMGYLMFVTQKPEWLTKIVEGKQYKKVKRSKKGVH